MLAYSRFFRLRRLAVPIITLAPKHHHDNTHERTEENGQEGNDCVGIDLARHHEKSDESSNDEEDEKCFP